MRDYGWAPYVPVAQRRAQARKQLAKLKKKGLNVEPVELSGSRRKIATSFWGEGWCKHMESFSDYANRLPRGRTYVRNGSVCHLEIKSGQIKAIVSGSTLYNVKISISQLQQNRWREVKRACTGKIASLIDLLRGRLDKAVMAVVADRQTGLFPLPGEMKFACDCPDWADMCKHVAAVLYGVGARLDTSPEMLFVLRGVNHGELVDVSAAVTNVTRKGGTRRRLAATAVDAVFGIDLSASIEVSEPAPAKALKRTTGVSAPGSPFPEMLTGDVIHAWRTAMGETQAEFAERLKVSAGSISQWERKGGKAFGVHQRTRAALHKAWMLTSR